MTALVRGVDSSTQSTKVELRDLETGACVAFGRAPHPPVHPPCSEQDPHDWWRAFEVAGQHAGREREVVTTSIAAQQHGLVALDSSDEPIRPAKLWNDTESAPDARWLVEQLDDGALGWACACGSVPVSALTITKLSWLHRTEPERFARLAHVMLPHDYLGLRLTGERATDRGDASGTGYWSPVDGCWRTDLLEIVDRGTDWGSLLPEVREPGDALGTGDNMAAALGLGLRPHDVVISLGTSGTVFTVSDAPVADPTAAVAGFADAAGGFLPLVCTLNATRVTDAIAGLLGVDHAGLDALALAAPAGADGLTLLPYLDGERTPDRPGASGTLTGLRSDTSREQLARAAFEGVACGLLDGLDALRRLDLPVDSGRVFVVGGGARSRAYPQVLADLARREVVVPDQGELVAVGACVQAAARHLGVASTEVAEAWGTSRGRTVEPSDGASAAAEVRAAYADARDRD